MTTTADELAFAGFLAGWAAARGEQCVADLPDSADYHAAHEAAQGYTAQSKKDRPNGR